MSFSLFPGRRRPHYRETPNQLQYMAEVGDALDLDRDGLPEHTTIYKSFERLKMWV